MRTVALTLGLVFFFATTFTIAHAEVVPGALLHLDASDNPGHPDGWANLGTAGGVVPAGEETPILESGATTSRGWYRIRGQAVL